MSLLAAFNGEAPMLVAAESLQNSRTVCMHRGFDSRLLRQTCERSKLPRFEVIFSRLIPVRRFAWRTDSRLADCALSRLPFMEATIAFIPFFLERNQCHAPNIL